MWGVEKEPWLQQATFAKTEGCRKNSFRASYRKIVSSRDFGEIFRSNGYSEEWTRGFDLSEEYMRARPYIHVAGAAAMTLSKIDGDCQS